jgi:hypothetical protein
MAMATIETSMIADTFPNLSYVSSKPVSKNMLTSGPWHMNMLHLENKFQLKTVMMMTIKKQQQ